MMRGAFTERRRLRAMISSALAKCDFARSASGKQTFGKARSATTRAGSLPVMPACNNPSRGR
jgi:hypothetical protein